MRQHVQVDSVRAVADAGVEALLVERHRLGDRQEAHERLREVALAERTPQRLAGTVRRQQAGVERDLDPHAAREGPDGRHELRLERHAPVGADLGQVLVEPVERVGSL